MNKRTIKNSFSSLARTLFVAGSVGLFVAGAVQADTTGLTDQIQTHCVSCHGEKKAKGGLNLNRLLSERPLLKNREQWNHVIDLVREGSMPPEDEPQPSKADRGEILAELDLALNHFDYSEIDNPGFESARRMTNEEYNRTVSDLLGLSLRPADRFPSDLTGASGFENSANTLFLQTVLMERYIAAAEGLVETAFPVPTPSGVRPETPPFRRVFTAWPNQEEDVLAAAQEIIHTFLLRAYRRPPNDSEMDQAISYFEKIYRPHKLPTNFVQSIKQVVQATLISPKFLFRVEQGSASPEPYRITQFELAARLSYFLWATMPDDELFQLASAGRLFDEEILDQQIDRMLAHPYADSLGSIFAAQWLGFRFIGNRIRLDPIDNPWCTDSLMTAMRQQSGRFFTSLIRENRYLDDLVTADYTFLNEELATEIYARDDVVGPELRRVPILNPNRRGLLTHASLMAVTSNYKDTSPIKRGNWILETVLGRPLPPPPPNAGAFKEEVEDNDSLTFRQKVELHSSDPNCRSCHSKIDPLGFSLENFDYFGRWRSHYRVRVVERNDVHALELSQAMVELSWEDLNERIHELDTGPDARRAIRQWLQDLRALTVPERQREITTVMSISEQARLIQTLDRLEIENENSEEARLRQGITLLRNLTEDELSERLQSLDADAEERAELRTLAWEIRAIPVPRLEEEFDDDLMEIAEELLEWFDFLDEHPRRRSRYESKPITAEAVLPDGTPFVGPQGLQEVLLENHRSDIARQLCSKLLAYALGRQLEYFDEGAIRQILDRSEQQKFPLKGLIRGIVTSYPFQFKRNPTPPTP